MSLRRFGSILSFVAAATIWSDPICAESTTSKAADAQHLFDEALALLDQNRAAEACPKLEQSLQLDPGIGTQFRLADCYERIGKRATAYRLFDEVARRCAVLSAPEHEQVAIERKTALKGQLQYLELRIESPVDGQELSIDQSPIARDQWSMRLPIDPGEHRFEARAEGHVAQSGSVSVSMGSQVTPLFIGRLKTRLPESHQFAASVTAPMGTVALRTRPNQIRTYRTIGYIGTGVGVLGLAIGGFYGATAVSKKNDSDPQCAGKTCNSLSAADLHNQAVTAGNLSTIFFVAGGVVTAGSLALLFSLPNEHRPPLTAGVGFATNSAFARLGGEF
jgi:hypothetical protein